MKRPGIRAFATLLLVLLLFGCKTDQEKVKETLEAYTNAVVLYRAPYQAYVHLDPADKNHVSVEAFASSFDQRYPEYPAGTRLKVGDVDFKADRAETTVEVSPPTGETETRRYVLRRDGTRWRVWLGLELMEKQRAKLDEAKRLADEAALQEAREKLEEVASTTFEASRPELIEQEATKLRQWLDQQKRTAELDTALTEAMKADLAGMRRAEAELSKRIDEKDEKFFDRLTKLRDEINLRERQKAMDEFTFEDIRARSFRDAWGIFREVRFKTTNNTGRPLEKLGVRLELINDEDEAPVGSTVWQLIEQDATLPAGQLLEVKREVDKAPDEWKGRAVRIVVEELEFAEEKNDAG